jgi:hypothetical protein
MKKEKLLTIGMATYDDYDGVYFTIQALRMYHPICQTDEVEFVVIDNNPDGKHGKDVKKFINQIKQVYIPYKEKQSSFSKYKVVDYASGKYVIIMDCHVLLFPNAINELLNYFKENPDCKDLIQGPMFNQSLNTYNTHWEPKYRGHMYGIWANDKESYEKGEPFEIPLQGMALMSFERNNFPKISQHFNGFGGEQGTIHEYFKNNGGKIICHPKFSWVHRFDRPNGVPFPLTLEDRVFNYFLGSLDVHNDLNRPFIKETYNYFKDILPNGVIDKLLNKAINLTKK